MSQDQKRRIFSEIPLPPDPLEVLREVEEALEGAQTNISEVDTQLRQIDHKLSGIDHKLRIPSPPKPPATDNEIVNLVRAHYPFSCPICEEIANRVSKKFTSAKDKISIYEAVYKLSASDNKQGQDTALKTLGDMGVKQETMQEIKTAWEKLKEQETQT
jgi:hypothetical protein